MQRALLDEVSTAHPLLVIHYSYHAAVANSAALAAAGYTEDSPEPTGGELVRDAAGRLTGVLNERAFTEGYLGHGGREALLPQAGVDARVESLRAMLGRLSAAGVTSVCDALVHPVHWEVYQAAREGGVLTGARGDAAVVRVLRPGSTVGDGQRLRRRLAALRRSEDDGGRGGAADSPGVPRH